MEMHFWSRIAEISHEKTRFRSKKFEKFTLKRISGQKLQTFC